ncbi:MAG: DUF445 domain-containing protein [Candidatus Latescibacteria bacterium]|jgi:uncharacterized membrane protein YheB (UPF0754 family)|nr:DUF445 domain-containing protein [Candidatus Latescibacterota bacterium]
MNKSLATNLITIALIAIGYVSPIYADHIFTIGLFATSGAITNWLAVHMLFEKVPLLYGSGVIPSRFEEFKIGIHALIMKQFFTAENVENFFAAQTEDMKKSFDTEPVIAAIDYDRIFARLVEAVVASPFGGMLGMVGGPSALQPLRDPFIEKVREEIRLLLSSPKFLDAVQDSLGATSHTSEIIDKVDAIVIHRLDELTPQMVKTIVQDMIHKHLGWLVVWGGVFGGLIGLIASFVT